MLNVVVMVIVPCTEAAVLDDTAVIVREEMLNREPSRFLFMSKHRSVTEQFIANVQDSAVFEGERKRVRKRLALYNGSSLKALTFDEPLHNFRVGSYNHPDRGGAILDCTDMLDDSISAHSQDMLVARMSGRRTPIVVLVGPHSKPFNADGVIAKQIIADMDADV